MFRVLKTILTVVLAIMLVFAVFTLITSKSGVLMGVRSFVVLSGSMQPTIPTGAIVFSQKQLSYNPKDIISFTENNGVNVTHRIAETVSQNGQIFYRTKGDANNTVDTKLVPASEVIGKAILSIPYIGYISGFLKTFPGFIFLIVLPTSIFIGSEILTIKKELEIEIETKLRRELNNTNPPSQGFIDMTI